MLFTLGNEWPETNQDLIWLRPRSIWHWYTAIYVYCHDVPLFYESKTCRIRFLEWDGEDRLRNDQDVLQESRAIPTCHNRYVSNSFHECFSRTIELNNETYVRWELPLIEHAGWVEMNCDIPGECMVLPESMQLKTKDKKKKTRILAAIENRNCSNIISTSLGSRWCPWQD